MQIKHSVMCALGETDISKAQKRLERIFHEERRHPGKHKKIMSIIRKKQNALVPGDLQHAAVE